MEIGSHLHNGVSMRTTGPQQPCANGTVQAHHQSAKDLADVEKNGLNDTYGAEDISSKAANDAYDPDDFDPARYEQPDSWQRQFSIRGFLVSVPLIFLIIVIVLRSNLAVGITPPLAVPAGLLTFLCLKTWTQLLHRLGVLHRPFTQQENTVVQTCVVAGGAMALGLGWAGPLMALTKQVQIGMGPRNPYNRLADTSEPTYGKTYAMQPLVGFTGVFVLISLRKLFIINMDMPWPSGTAVGVLMNKFHSVAVGGSAVRQLRCMLEWCTTTFLWAMFRWMFSGYNGMCGFERIPFFGLRAQKYGWSWKLETYLIGSGMITPHIVSWSMMLGAILSWGILYPWLTHKAGIWYPAATVGTESFSGMAGYRVFLGLAFILGGSLYNMGQAAAIGITRNRAWWAARRGGSGKVVAKGEDKAGPSYSMNPIDETPLERRVRRHYFLQDSLPGWWGAAGYLAFAVVGSGVIPQIYPQVKWYHCVLMYLATPFLSIANAYCTGWTDQNLASIYGSVSSFAVAAAVGLQSSGVLVGLVICLVLKANAYSAIEMLQDFKTGYYTLSSPRAMLGAQLLGTAVGCILAPVGFFIFWNAFPLGKLGSSYQAPLAYLFRGVALVGVQGFDALPRHCLWMCLACFLLALGIEALRSALPPRYARFVPFPVAMGLPFFLGTYLPIEYCIGSVARALWRLHNPASEAAYMPAVATGLIVGDSLWALPAAFLALGKVQPPMCMAFFRSFPTNKAYPNGF